MIQLKEIAEVVNHYFGLDIRKNSRKREYVMAKSIYYYIARKYTKRSLMAIGREINRDHATVLHGLKLYEQDRKVLQDLTDDITTTLGITNFEYRCIIC